MVIYFFISIPFLNKFIVTSLYTEAPFLRVARVLRAYPPTAHSVDGSGDYQAYRDPLIC